MILASYFYPTYLGPFDLPEGKKLRKIRNLTSVMVPTVAMEVRALYRSV